MGFSRQEYWSGLPFPSPGDLSNPGIEPLSPALQADTLTSEPPGKPQSHVQLFVTPWTVSCQASLSITNSQSLLRFTSIESVMPFNHFILSHSLFLLPSIFLSIRVFSNESVLSIRWPKTGVSALAPVLPMNIQD